MSDHVLEPLTTEEEEVVKASRGPMCILTDLMRTEPRTITVTSRFKYMQIRLTKMTVRSDDVWVLTPPKCGTTWTQEMTWLIMNKADTKTATEKDFFARTPFLDFAMIKLQSQEEVDGFFDGLDALPSPRLLKTHLPFELLPPILDICKVIFVSRNIKDAAVSFFKHERLFKFHDLAIDNFDEYARNIYQPGLCLLGDYWFMLGSGWARRNHDNMLFLWYEEMKEDQKKTIMNIATHTGYSLTEEEVDKIEDHTKFDNMKKTLSLNKADNPMFFEGRGNFMRKGQVGDWTNHFSPALAEEWDLWAEEELKKIGVEDKRVKSYYDL